MVAQWFEAPLTLADLCPKKTSDWTLGRAGKRALLRHFCFCECSNKRQVRYLVVSLCYLERHIERCNRPTSTAPLSNYLLTVFSSCVAQLLFNILNRIFRLPRLSLVARKRKVTAPSLDGCRFVRYVSCFDNLFVNNVKRY